MTPDNSGSGERLFVAYTNSDCTEGRGYDIPIAVCVIEATAIRLAKGKYVQGTNGPVRSVEKITVNGRLYVPVAAVHIINPTHDDLTAQKAIDAKRAAIEKARAAGLSDDDLQALTR